MAAPREREKGNLVPDRSLMGTPISASTPRDLAWPEETGAHTEWAQSRGTAGRGVGDRKSVGWGCGTVSGAVPLKLH